MQIIDPSKKILLVDDSQMTRKLLKRLLQELGFKNIFIAKDASSAKSTLLKHYKEKMPFDLLLSDINMPGQNGLELLKEIRADKLIGNIKIILCTSENEMENIIRAVDLGANDYIVKPVLKNILEEKLIKHCGMTNLKM